ncbi:MAG TPA: toll/interleukin-1 receptor domain-containing protein, partial [Thermoanaerobaculia bacterium]
MARSIAEALSLRHVDYFLDQQSLRVGDDIVREIGLAIEKSCTHLLLLASFASEKVSWVRDELALAREHGLHLIPMVIAARENELPEFVRGLKTLYSPLRQEVATLFRYLGLGEPPDLEKGREVDAEFLPVLCDRKDEQTAFEQALDDSERKLAGAPKFCCLVGDYRARHDLFVVRIRERVLATLARFLGTAGAPGTIRSIEINWPVKWPRRHRLLPLLEALSKSLNRPWPQADQLTAEGIASLVRGLRESVLVVVHPIPPERWLPETSRLLSDYLAWWRDTVEAMRQPAHGQAAPRKEVVVLFTVTWSGTTDQAVRRRVETALEMIEEKTRRSRTLAPFTTIRLSTVDDAKVNDWLSTFPYKGLAFRTKEYCRKLFETASERQLDDVIDEYFRAL